MKLWGTKYFFEFCIIFVYDFVLTDFYIKRFRVKRFQLYHIIRDIQKLFVIIKNLYIYDGTIL